MLGDSCDKTTNEVKWLDLVDEEIRQFNDSGGEYNDESESFKLFGEKYDFGALKCDPSNVFDRARCYLSRLEYEAASQSFSYAAATSSAIICSSSSFDFRSDFNSFFGFLMKFLRRLKFEEVEKLKSTNIVRRIINETKGLLLDVGYLHDIANSVTNKNTDYLHHCLNIRWNVLKAICLTIQQWPDLESWINVVNLEDDYARISSSADAVPLLNYIKWQLLDLLLIRSCGQHNQSVVSRAESSLFPCACFKLFWFLIKSTVDRFNSKDHHVSKFADLLKWAFVEIRSNKSDYRRNIEFVNSDEFYPRSVILDPNLKDQDEIFWQMLHDLSTLPSSDDFLAPSACFLLKTTLTEHICNEALYPRITAEWESKFRRSLAHFAQFNRKNATDADAYHQAYVCSTLELLDAFCKRINESFHTGPTLDDIQSNAQTQGSAQDWLEQIAAFCKSAENVKCKFTCSYALFLNIVGLRCRDSKVSRVMRGRAFSKFHAGKLKELSERGLVNFFDLFLVLAHSSGVREVSDRLADYLANFDVRDTTASRMKLICKSFAVLTLISIQNDIDGSTCCSKIRHFFNAVLEQYTSIRFDLNVRRDLFDVLMHTIDFGSEILQEINRKPNGSLISHCAAVNEMCDLNIDKFLREAKDDMKQNHAVRFIEFCRRISDYTKNLVETYNSEVSNSGDSYAVALTEKLVEKIRLKILPICRKMPATFTDCAMVPVSFYDLCYNLIVILYIRRRGETDVEYTDFFSGIVWSSDSAGRQLCRLLGLLVSHPLLVDVFPKTTVIQAFMRCLMTIPSTDQESALILRPVTDFLLKEHYLPSNLESASSGSSSLSIFRDFCTCLECDKNVEMMGSNFLDLPVRFACDLLKTRGRFSTLSKQRDICVQCHVCICHLAHKCAQLLHKRDDPKSLLKNILEQTILFCSKIVDADERTCRIEAINANFAQVVHGLLSIPGWLYDPFLKKALTESYRLSFERLALLPQSRLNPHQNFNFLMEPLRPTFGSELEQFSDALLLRRYCLWKTAIEILNNSPTIMVNKPLVNSSGAVAVPPNKNTAHPTFSTPVVHILLNFWTRLVDMTKNDEFLAEECEELMPHVLNSWLKSCDESSSSIYLDASTSVFQKLLEMKCLRASNIVDDIIKKFLKENLRDQAEKTIKILKYFSRDAVIRSKVNIQDLYLFQLSEIDKSSGGSVSNKMWSIDFKR